MKLVLPVIAALLFLAASAVVARVSAVGLFIENRQQWEEWDAGQKILYLQGFTDGLLATNLKDHSSFMQDLSRCFDDLKISGLTLLRIVESQYQDVSNWGLPPSVVLIAGSRKMCLPRINGYRAERGEEPLKP